MLIERTKRNRTFPQFASTRSLFMELRFDFTKDLNDQERELCFLFDQFRSSIGENVSEIPRQPFRPADSDRLPEALVEELPEFERRCSI